MRFVLFSLTPPLLEVIPHQETTAYLINDAGAKACLEVGNSVASDVLHC